MSYRPENTEIIGLTTSEVNRLLYHYNSILRVGKEGDSDYMSNRVNVTVGSDGRVTEIIGWF